MSYRIFLFTFLIFYLSSCKDLSDNSLNKSNIEFENRYKNIGFALIYNEKLDSIKSLEKRSLNIYHKTLKKNLL